MSKPTTLGEYIERRTGGDNTLLRRIVYGTDEPCPTCHGLGTSDDAPVGYTCNGPCHGTGRIKTLGLKGRLQTAFLCGDGTYDGFAVERLLEAIRREIGEAP